MVVKPPSGTSPPGSLPPSSAPPAQPASGKAPLAPPATTNVINPEAVAKAVKDYQSLERKLKKPFMSGAAGLFTDNIVFPTDLLDPTNPANDPRYLHLFAAVLKLTSLIQYFSSPEQNEEKEREEKEGEKEGEQQEDSENEDSEF